MHTHIHTRCAICNPGGGKNTLACALVLSKHLLCYAHNTKTQASLLEPHRHTPTLSLLCVMQAMGENTLAGALALSKHLHTTPAPQHSGGDAKSVFFDVGGFFMVSLLTTCMLCAVIPTEPSALSEPLFSHTGCLFTMTLLHAIADDTPTWRLLGM